MAITETFSVEGLVSVERGEVDRRIFSDQEIFDAEMELIFGRAWQFLCHESQIPKAGDFFETPVGLDNVLAVRQKDGTIKGLLNTCAHRGNAVCRADEGNTKVFMCTYHGWSYDLAGNLIGVPGLDRFYKGDLDMTQHGLGQVAQLASYHGFVFATMDSSAPSLEDYLGPTGRLGIDLLAIRGNIERHPRHPKVLDRLQLEVRGRQPVRLVSPAGHPHVGDGVGHHPAVAGRRRGCGRGKDDAGR